MKHIIIVCEGQTEQSFCNDVLQKHFNELDIYIYYPTIKKPQGGIVKWEFLKSQVEKHLIDDNRAFVTTLIDYYGMQARHKYPFWQTVQSYADKNLAVTQIESGMLADLSPDFKSRFIPYIQLHEFEGLLFSDMNVFNNNFEESEFLDYGYLVNTINQYPNPELINDGNETAPSKRLSKIIKGYFSDNENYKVVYGSLLAHDIGLQKIRSKCPRFNNWITRLENI